MNGIQTAEATVTLPEHLTAQVETLRGGGLDELKPLLPIHYKELSLHQFHGIPLNPQYHIYLDREDRGEVMYVTLRQGGQLCGYFVGFIAPGLHYQDCLTLTLDIFYLLPEFRGNGGGVTLFAEVQRELQRRGAKAWFVGLKEHLREHAEALFLQMGFEKSEQYYCKWFGGD